MNVTCSDSEHLDVTVTQLMLGVNGNLHLYICLIQFYFVLYFAALAKTQRKMSFAVFIICIDSSNDFRLSVRSDLTVTIFSSTPG